MNDVRMWVVAFWVVILAVLVVGMLAYARGPEHHRGNDVGAFGESRTPSLSAMV
jgi:hypothetical protein